MILRLLHVLISAHPGGAERMCLNLASEHLRSGHEVHVLLPARGEVRELAERMGVPVIAANWSAAEQRGKRAFRKAFSRDLAEAVRAAGTDLVHSHVPLTHLLCERTLPKLNLPWIATVHGSWRQFGYAPIVERQPWRKPLLMLRHAIGDYLSTRSAARVVAISEYVRQELVLVGVPASKIVTIHNGLPEFPITESRQDARARYDLPPDALVIGSLGYFAPVKGFDLLIEAFARLAPKYGNLRLLIGGGDVLGDDSMRRSLQRLIDQRGLSGRAQLITISGNESAFLSALDIFAVASRTEGFSLALADAMRHGKASVVTSAGGCVEVARPGEEALVFESENIGSLSDNLDQLILNKKLRDVLGQAAWARASIYLTLPRCAEDYEKLYRTVLAAPAAARK